MENKRYKIMLVEDDKLDQMAFKRSIEDQMLPYDCTMAGSISEAKNILSSEKYDIIISDYSLGDGTAFDFFDIIKDTPLILVTGAGDEETAVTAMRAGSYDYLIKDVERNYLKAIPITVENAIRHKKTEEKLRLLSGAIMSTNDSVYITDMEDKIIFVNKAFRETYGYTEEEIIGNHSNVLWIGKPDSENTRSVFQMRSVGSTWEVGFYHKRKDASILPVSLSRSIIKDSKNNKVAVVSVAHDISERILIEDELRTDNLKLERHSQLKSELAVTVAESLNNLLANNNIDKAKRIIGDYLDISKIETGKMKLEPSKFDLRSAVSEIEEAISPLAFEKGIILKSSMSDSEFLVEADRNRVMQILNILVSHSIKSVSTGGHINILLRETDKNIRLEVQDDGSAIDTNEIYKAFNHMTMIKEHLNKQNEQSSHSISLDDTNDGPKANSCDSLLDALSLPIAKVLVELHGGRLYVENKQEQGNNFYFTLPKLSELKEEESITMVSVNTL